MYLKTDMERSGLKTGRKSDVSHLEKGRDLVNLAKKNPQAFQGVPHPHPWNIQHTVDLSVSAVHICIKSAIFTNTVPFMGVADTNCPSILVT